VSPHTIAIRRLPTSSGFDPLADEGATYVASPEAGVAVFHRHLPGQIHGFLTMGPQLLTTEGARSISENGSGAFRNARDCQTGGPSFRLLVWQLLRDEPMLSTLWIET
jgi:hypothetical protein